MYIGPWQEYKLAKLIQHHHQQQTPQQTPQPQSQRLGSRQRRPLVPRPDSKNCNDDTASVTSSTRSGISFSGNSTQSAPSQLPSNHSAQSRLNNFYEQYERGARRDAVNDAESAASSQQTRRLPPRPRSSSQRLQPKAAAKKRPKAKAGQSFEEERRARILHMKKLYGLGGEPEVELEAPVSNASQATMSRANSSATLRLAASPSTGYLPAPMPVVDADSFTPDFDRALHDLQASMNVREEVHHPEPFSGRGQEDPMALSMSESMGGSGGLIAWSKNLRPEDLSPDVTLASFLRPL